MELSRAIEIVEALRDGHDPYTGEVFEQTSVFQKADTVRALTLAVETLKSQKRNSERKRRLPENAGNLWTKEEQARLIEAFDEERKVREIAKDHGRTRRAIRIKLSELGKIQYWGNVQD